MSLFRSWKGHQPWLGLRSSVFPGRKRKSKRPCSCVYVPATIGTHTHHTDHTSRFMHKFTYAHIFVDLHTHVHTDTHKTLIPTGAHRHTRTPIRILTLRGTYRVYTNLTQNTHAHLIHSYGLTEMRKRVFMQKAQICTNRCIFTHTQSSYTSMDRQVPRLSILTL